MAKLRFYYGAMGSAKSMRLLTTAYNFDEKGINFLILKPSCDIRDGESTISSRVGLKRDCLSIDSTVNIVNFIGLKEIQWILVDEAQFLTKKQVEELAEMVDVFNVEVMCFGLRTDFQSNFFEGSKRLMELSDEIEEIKSRCDCGRKTSINARFDENNNLLIDGEQIVIGGNDKYKALCRKCWFEMKNQIENKQK